MTDFGVDGYIKMETPNCWECPKCVKTGRAIKLEQPTFGPSGVPLAVSSGPTPPKVLKTEDGEVDEHEDKKVIAYGADSTFSGYQLFSVKKTRPDQSKQELRAQLAQQILSASSHAQRTPPHVFRPPPLQLSAEEIYERRREAAAGGGEDVDLKMERGIMLRVFQQLDTVDLSNCVVVCRVSVLREDAIVVFKFVSCEILHRPTSVRILVTPAPITILFC